MIHLHALLSLGPPSPWQWLCTWACVHKHCLCIIGYAYKYSLISLVNTQSEISSKWNNPESPNIVIRLTFAKFPAIRMIHVRIAPLTFNLFFPQIWKDFTFYYCFWLHITHKVMIVPIKPELVMEERWPTSRFTRFLNLICYCCGIVTCLHISHGSLFDTSILLEIFYSILVKFLMTLGLFTTP